MKPTTYHSNELGRVTVPESDTEGREPIRQQIYRLTNRKGQTAIVFSAVNADEAILLADAAGTIRGAIVKVELMRQIRDGLTTARYEVERVLSNRDA